MGEKTLLRVRKIFSKEFCWRIFNQKGHFLHFKLHFLATFPYLMQFWFIFKWIFSIFSSKKGQRFFLQYKKMQIMMHFPVRICVLDNNNSDKVSQLSLFNFLSPHHFWIYSLFFAPCPACKNTTVIVLLGLVAEFTRAWIMSLSTSERKPTEDKQQWC